MESALIQARSVNLTRGGRVVLTDIDLSIGTGECVAIIGPNGAGKSTLLHLLAGGIRAGSGTVNYSGQNLNAWGVSGLALRRAVLTQSTHITFPFLVGEALLLSVPENAPHRDLPLLCNRALARVGLCGFESRQVTELSGGEQQRVHLARILVQLWATQSGQPQTLFLDEPVTGLDLAHQMKTMELARSMVGETLSVVAVVHDMNIALHFATRIICLSEGRIVGDGDPRELLTIGLIEKVFGTKVEIYRNDAGSPVVGPAWPAGHGT
ncbi:heme ABC transporter ATP-binding protein [Aestuariivirga sp.]|uniref:heme ABC transporter ATP-binding protein n=1 Tax=Aestuariivirga sp. TaxID=2650926 RepID=UPI0039E5442E